MSAAETAQVRVPVKPPVVLVAGLAAGAALARLFPGPMSGRASWSARLLLAAPLLAAGLLMVHASRQELGRHGVHPRFRPVATLVTTGPFSLSRNPMYVGAVAATCGLAVLANSWWVLAAGLAPFLLYLGLLVIPREERELERVFGQQYRRYCEDTPRWLFCFRYQFWC